MRSTSSSALNYGEAQGAESTKDYIHKIGLVIKELRESRANLIMIKESKICKDNNEIERLLQENDELIAILYSASMTAKKRLNDQRQ